MKRADSPIARAIIAASLEVTKRDKMRSIYEGIAPAFDGCVHSFQNPAGTECVAGDSYVLTASGMREIQHLPRHVKVWDGEECVVPEKHVAYPGRDGFELTTAYGFVLRGSAEHPVMTRRGWVKMCDLLVGDEVEVAFGSDIFGSVCPITFEVSRSGTHKHITPPTFVTPALAELVGMWLADGVLNDTNGSYAITISNSDPEVLARFSELSEEVFGFGAGVSHNSERVDTAFISSREAVDFFRLLGLRGIAREKVIPSGIFAANKSTLRALLRGLTLDSHPLAEKRTFAYGTQSPRLREQLHLLLTNMGILASRGHDKLVISRPYLAKFLDLVGFVQTTKAEEAGRFLNERLPERPPFDGWVRVKKIVPWKGDVYDVAMPKRHEYVANGLRVHNTSRFSHSSTWLFDPGSYNLATLPKKTASENPLFRVRDVITPHPGRVLMAADYSRAEARWCAYIAGDEARIELQESGIDEYRVFAALVAFDDEDRWEEVPKQMRNSIGKVGVLSGQYQVGWKTLQTSVNKDFELHGVSIDAKTAKKMEAIWPTRFPRTCEWWREVEDSVLTTKTTVNPLGRRRIYFGRDDSESARRAIVREAIADGPQSSNAMAVNAAMRRLYEAYDPTLLRILLQVHDEILFDCAPKDMLRVAKVVKEEMERPFNVDGRTLVIPAEVNATSTNWSEMKEIYV